MSTCSSFPPAAPPLRALCVDATVVRSIQTRRARVPSELCRVSSVRVQRSVKENGHRYYVVDVTSAAPTALRLGPGEATASTIKWRIADFFNLRDEMSFFARSGHRHHDRPCEFCMAGEAMVTAGPQLPRLHELLLRQPEALYPPLDQFLNAALRLVLSIKHHREYACTGQRIVPQLVRNFLLGDGGPIDDCSERNVQCRPTLLSFN